MDKELVRVISYEDDKYGPLVRALSYEEDLPLYLILIEGTSYGNEELEIRTFEFKKGRQESYDFIKDLLVNENEDKDMRIDVSKSKILVDSEKIRITNYISLYKFMKQSKVKNLVKDDTSFDIDDYFEGEEI